MRRKRLVEKSAAERKFLLVSDHLLAGGKATRTGGRERISCRPLFVQAMMRIN
ncbi:MAG: hypothetical protein H5U05_03215 [Candidatus Aminicenantes bacterium]|nr:hypothetical protein [Candidatus Aminicenantes bacterium]